MTEETLAVSHSETITDDSYNKRMQSYNEGIKLYLNSLGKTTSSISSAKLKKINTTYAEYILKAETLKQKRKLFSKYLSLNARYIAKNTEQETKVVFNDIKTAEVLHAWSTKRKQTATNIIVNEKNTSNKLADINLQEEPITDLSTQQQDEFASLLNKNSASHPVWFTILPEWQRNYLYNKLAQAKKNGHIDFKEFCQSIPSTLRTIPGLPNYSAHSITITVGTAGSETFTYERYRSSIVSPIDIFDVSITHAKDKTTKIAAKNDSQRLTTQNVGQLLDNNLQNLTDAFQKLWGNSNYQLPVLLQTLISPGKSDKIVKYASKRFNSKGMVDVNRMVKEKNCAADNIISNNPIITTNHGVNDMRKGKMHPVLAEERQHNNEQMVKLTNTYNNFIKNVVAEALTPTTQAQTEADRSLKIALYSFINDTSYPLSGTPSNKLTDIKMEIPQYKNQQQKSLSAKQINALELATLALHGHNKITRDYPNKYADNRNLFLSSLEQILTQSLGGLAHGSCKSGKDRKGVEVMHTDAMLIYFHVYGKLPELNDKPTERKNFVNIFVHLFLSKHHQNNAELNAPGVNAMKALKKVLPKDIQAALANEKIDQVAVLDWNNEIASLNKPSLFKAKTDLNTELDTELTNLIGTEQQTENEGPININQQIIEDFARYFKTKANHDFEAEESDGAELLTYNGDDLLRATTYNLANKFHYKKTTTDIIYNREENQQEGQEAPNLEEDEIETIKTIIDHSYALGWQPLLSGTNRTVIIAYAYAEAHHNVDGRYDMPEIDTSQKIDINKLSELHQKLYKEMTQRFSKLLEGESKPELLIRNANQQTGESLSTNLHSFFNHPKTSSSESSESRTHNGPKMGNSNS